MSLQRGDRGRPEDQVLMRALRDFNIPKIVTDDVPVFMGLIGDLFPALDVPRKRDLDFEKMVKQAAIDLQLQPEENFILKVLIHFYSGTSYPYLVCFTLIEEKVAEWGVSFCSSADAVEPPLFDVLSFKLNFP